ncbi:MAG: HAD family phosphatase [Solobacterium sp.]|nr:HAD family phosphatase [Solobacterium sp.]
MIRAILFDMDGILFDSEKHYMEGTIDQMRAYGYEGEEKNIYRIIGTTMERTYAILYELLEGKVDIETLRRNNEYYFTFLHPLNYKELMFDGLKEIIERFREEGLKLALCSSSPKETILEALKDMGIEDAFSVILSSEEVDKPKPYPDVYCLAQERLGIPKEECIVYEDSQMGIEAGKRAGIKTIARMDDRYGQDQSEADIQVKDIQEVYEIVRKENENARSN